MGRRAVRMQPRRDAEAADIPRHRRAGGVLEHDARRRCGCAAAAAGRALHPFGRRAFEQRAR
eukprot:646772-Prymnesium_polylepis.1